MKVLHFGNGKGCDEGVRHLEAAFNLIQSMHLTCRLTFVQEKIN